MLIKRKLYSVMDEEGNLGYYLYDESTGEEKLFSVVEEEKLFSASVIASKVLGKGNKALNRAAKKAFERNTPVGTLGIKDPKVFRRANSPVAINNGTWAKDMGANKLQTKISRRGGNQYLGNLAGTSGKTSWTGGTIVGGGYTV